MRLALILAVAATLPPHRLVELLGDLIQAGKDAGKLNTSTALVGLFGDGRS